MYTLNRVVPESRCARLSHITITRPVSDLSWAVHEERGRPLGRFYVGGIRWLIDLSVHILKTIYVYVRYIIYIYIYIYISFLL